MKMGGFEHFMRVKCITRHSERGYREAYKEFLWERECDTDSCCGVSCSKMEGLHPYEIQNGNCSQCCGVLDELYGKVGRVPEIKEMKKIVW